MQLKTLYKNILLITGKLILLLFFLISTAFVNNEFKKKKVENIHINIISTNQPLLSNEEDIKKYIQRHNYQLEEKRYHEINFHNLENTINQKNEVKNTVIYFTPNKELNITIIERKPIAKIITNNISYYIDDEWKIMSAKNKPAYKVPLIIGEIFENTSTYKNYPIYKILPFENLSSISLFDDIYNALHTITSDSLLSNFIDYIYIDKHQEITLYPIIGKFEIVVGNSEHFQEKMNKLKLFIIHGLNKNDAWNKYSQINLKYQNLIYCTKK